MLKKTIWIIIIIITNVSVLYWISKKPTDEDYYGVRMIPVELNGKIDTLILSKRVLFGLDNDKGYYCFSKRNKNIKCINCEPNEIFYECQIGDSVIKEKNSQIITIKRDEKIFIVHINKINRFQLLEND